MRTPRWSTCDPRVQNSSTARAYAASRRSRPPIWKSCTSRRWPVFDGTNRAWTRGMQDLLVGQGQVGGTLRNLLLEAAEKENGDWEDLVGHVRDLFGIGLRRPVYSPAQPYILCEYDEPKGSGRPLDLANAGSGTLHVILLLAFLYARPAPVMLLDGPDAHQHVVLQKQVYGLPPQGGPGARRASRPGHALPGRPGCDGPGTRAALLRRPVSRADDGRRLPIRRGSSYDAGGRIVRGRYKLAISGDFLPALCEVAESTATTGPRTYPKAPGEPHVAGTELRTHTQCAEPEDALRADRPSLSRDRLRHRAGWTSPSPLGCQARRRLRLGHAQGVRRQPRDRHCAGVCVPARRLRPGPGRNTQHGGGPIGPHRPHRTRPPSTSSRTASLCAWAFRRQCSRKSERFTTTQTSKR